ncbi:hypothetical protein FB451DRAFT_1526748 [Mycena latifolia]|nr:hypothetical protein FB451DRAFT_1526748 [Mycena latifolia]
MVLRDRDPEIVVRNALIFPADGGDPRISPMTFNEGTVGASVYGFCIVDVDLRGLHGERNLYAMRQKGWEVTDQPDKITEGGYVLLHNVSPKLPVNVTMARLVGADPKKPGKRPLWRGDVVVVKTVDVPESFTVDCLVFPPQAIELFCSCLIPEWYNSDAWRDFLQDQQSWNETLAKAAQNFPRHLLHSNQAGFDGKTQEIKHRKRQDLDEIVSCGHCRVNSSSLDEPLRVCGGCRNEKYCSRDCQKLAWKGHKGDCRASRENGLG